MTTTLVQLDDFLPEPEAVVVDPAVSLSKELGGVYFDMASYLRERKSFAKAGTESAIGAKFAAASRKADPIAHLIEEKATLAYIYKELSDGIDVIRMETEKEGKK